MIRMEVNAIETEEKKLVKQKFMSLKKRSSS